MRWGFSGSEIHIGFVSKLFLTNISLDCQNTSEGGKALMQLWNYIISHRIMFVILFWLEGKYFCNCKHRWKDQFSLFYQFVTGTVCILKMQFEFNFREPTKQNQPNKKPQTHLFL